VLGVLCYIRQSRIADFASLCAKNCLPPQPNSEHLVYGEAYSQDMSVSGRQHRGVELKSWSSAPLCIASRWLTSLGLKPRHMPHMPCYMKTRRYPQNRKYITLHCRQRRTKPWPEVVSRKVCEVWTSGFWDMSVDRHTDMLITILCSRAGDELKLFLNQSCCQVFLLHVITRISASRLAVFGKNANGWLRTAWTACFSMRWYCVRWSI